MVDVNNVNQVNRPPKFSVLMANYNNGEYIGEAIESVLDQNFSDWELIVADDVSTDNSVEIVEHYLYDSRIRFLENEKNVGYIKTLIKLVSKAKSDIFGTLDSDDVLTSDALKVMHHAHKINPKSGLIYSQFIYCDKNLKPLGQGLSQVIPNGSTNLRCLYTGAFRTFKKDIYQKTEGFNPRYIYAEDRDIIFKMEEVTKVLFVDKPLYLHRVLLKGQSNNPKKKPIGHFFHIIAKYDAFCRRLETQIPNLTKKEMSLELCIASVLCLDIRKGKDAMKYFKSAINLNPILFFSMIHYLFNNIITRIRRLFYVGKTEPRLTYSKINQEIDRQATETCIE